MVGAVVVPLVGALVVFDVGIGIVGTAGFDFVGALVGAVVVSLVGAAVGIKHISHVFEHLFLIITPFLNLLQVLSIVHVFCFESQMQSLSLFCVIHEKS